MMGPVDARRVWGLSSGCATAKITNVASTMRSKISHNGVRAGVSSCGTNPSSNRIAGKAIGRGAGGVTRNSHQMIGSAANATSSHGETKAREPSASIGQLRPVEGSYHRLLLTLPLHQSVRLSACAERAAVRKDASSYQAIL